MGQHRSGQGRRHDVPNGPVHIGLVLQMRTDALRLDERQLLLLTVQMDYPAVSILLWLVVFSGISIVHSQCQSSTYAQTHSVADQF